MIGNIAKESSERLDVIIQENDSSIGEYNSKKNKPTFEYEYKDLHQENNNHHHSYNHIPQNGNDNGH